MAQTELEELRKYWTDKYPHIEVCFYPRGENDKYRGKMRSVEGTFDLEASTIGELIGQGESFIRAVKV